MIELVTLEQARQMLQIPDALTSENDFIVGLIRGSSRMVLSYLKLDEDAYLNSDGTMDLDSATVGYNEVPEEVQAATLYLIGVLYRDRDGAESEKWQHGFLPAPVVSMLYPLRDPSLA